MSKGIKFLAVGYENSGKTRLISQIQDALVASTDNKAFTGKVPHFRFNEYNGLQSLMDTFNEKISTYEAKYGKFPKNLIIDSVTHLAVNMEKYCNRAYTGFDIYKNLGKDTIEFNSYLEDVLLANGVNVIITAHTVYDSETSRHMIPAPGAFGKNGSWLSVVDNAIFLELKNGKRIIHSSTMKYPCRSTLTDFPESIPLSDYDINGHIALLEQLETDSAEYSL